MTDITVLKYVADKIDDYVRSLEVDLGTGAAKDYATYKEVCGNIKGLIRAKTLMVETYNNLNREDEDE